MHINKKTKTFLLCALLLCGVAACGRIACAPADFHLFHGQQDAYAAQPLEGLEVGFVVEALGKPTQYILAPIVSDSLERSKDSWTGQDKKGRSIGYKVDQDGSWSLLVDCGQGRKLSYKEDIATQRSVLSLSYEPTDFLGKDGFSDVPVKYETYFKKDGADYAWMGQEIIELGSGLGKASLESPKYLSEKDRDELLKSVHRAVAYIQKYIPFCPIKEKRPDSSLMKKNYEELRK